VSALKVILEDFEVSGLTVGVEGDVGSQKARAADYAEGFAAGAAAAAEKQQLDTAFFDATAAQLNKVLTDLPAELNQQLGEVLVTLIQKTLPVLAEKGFAQETATAVLNYADFGEPGTVIVKASKERAEQLTESFVRLGAENTVTIEVDPELSGSTVTAFWKHGGLEMDVDMAVRKSLECLECFASQSKEEKTNE